MFIIPFCCFVYDLRILQILYYLVYRISIDSKPFGHNKVLMDHKRTINECLTKLQEVEY